MRRRGGLVIGLLVGVLALAAAGCGGDGDDGGSAGATTAAPSTTSAETTTTAAGGGDNELQLVASDFAWDKTSLQMTAGSEASVEVRNEDTAQHSFTFDAASVDQVVPAGEDATASFTAPDAGSYEFRCRFHGSMTGTVTVT